MGVPKTGISKQGAMVGTWRVQRVHENESNRSRQSPWIFGLVKITRQDGSTELWMIESLLKVYHK